MSKPVSRISISLPPDLLDELDHMVSHRGYGSRSHAITEMIHYQLAEHSRAMGNEVMAGTLTLLYNRAKRGLQGKLADLQYQYVAEVISSLHVHLTEDHMLEVLLVQGPANQLQSIAHQMISLSGVITAHLQLLRAAIPPLHNPDEPIP